MGSNDRGKQEAIDGSPCLVDLNDGPAEPERALSDYGFIRFQCGPVAEAGVNGATIEIVTEKLIDRLVGFQRGEFACDENREAIEHYSAALAALQRRTARRWEQRVEGTSQKHVSDAPV
jgi:hypothetical protein